jgi:NUMOD4 motif
MYKGRLLIKTLHKARACPRPLKNFGAIVVETWKEIDRFPGYSVSDNGRIRTDKTGRILALNVNQYGVLQVGLMRNGIQFHRSVPLLVANAFLPKDAEPFDTPINLDGDRHNNHIANLAWRPRWFAIKYNQQFRYPYEAPIESRIMDLKTGEISENSFECAQKYGLLEQDLVLSILNRTYVWPTYQEFGVLEY